MTAPLEEAPAVVAAHLPAASTGHRDAVAGLFGRDLLFTVLWAVQVLAAAFVTPVITRLVSREEFGLFASANAAMQVIFVLAGAGLATAVQREHARGSAGRAHVLLTLAVVVAAAVTVVAHLTGPLWSSALGFREYGSLLQLTVLWAGSSAVTSAALALLRSQDRLAGFAAVSLLQSVVAEAGALLLVATSHSGGALEFILGQTAAQVAALALGLALVVPGRPRPGDSGVALAALRFSLPLVPAALSTFVLLASDRLVLQRELGPDAVGGYQLAANIGVIPLMLIGLLNTSWLPRMFASGGSGADVLVASRDAVNRLLPPIVLGMALGGPVVMRVWAPASYEPDTLTLVLAVIVVGTVPGAAATAATRTLLVIGSTTTVALATLAAAVLNVVLNLAVVPHLGVLGAALATTVSQTVLWLVLVTAAQRRFPLPPTPRATSVLLVVAVVAAPSSALLPGAGTALGLHLGAGLLALGWLCLEARAVRSGAQRSTSGAAA